jgi:deazaflavin-dependent oxidoreductase (nitroreductase family)
MAKVYQVTARQRRFNAVLVALLGRGLPLGPFYLLTVQGRKTGKSYRLPVAPIRHDDEWWLVSPYGEVDWVRNARAAGHVILTRGRMQRTFRLRELAPAESAPILREYLMRFARVRPYFDVGQEASLEALSAEAPRHPVFQLIAP